MYQLSRRSLFTSFVHGKNELCHRVTSGCLIVVAINALVRHEIIRTVSNVVLMADVCVYTICSAFSTIILLFDRAMPC